MNQMEIRIKSMIFWGSIGIFITSILYAMVPAATALPVANADPNLAIQQTQTYEFLIRSAGSVGLISDVILILGGVLFAILELGKSRLSQSLGWLLLALGTTFFVFVDAIAAYPLIISTKSNDFIIWQVVKKTFDVFWVLGSVTFAFSLLFLSTRCTKLVQYSFQIIFLDILFSNLGIILGFSLSFFLGAGILFGSLALSFYTFPFFTTKFNKII